MRKIRLRRLPQSRYSRKRLVLDTKITNERAARHLLKCDRAAVLWAIPAFKCSRRVLAYSGYLRFRIRPLTFPMWVAAEKRSPAEAGLGRPPETWRAD
jgi:hypothetical protein